MIVTFRGMLRPLLVLAVFLAGCAGSSRSSTHGEPQASANDEQYFSIPASEAPAAEQAASGYGSGPQAKYQAKYQPKPAPPQQAAPYAAGAPSARRLVQYSGAATLRSPEPERILDSAIARVEAAGGYLERRTPGFATLRVPTDDFDSLFQALLRLAEVIDYSQQAEDITEAAQDTEQRLKVVAATLDRLEDLIKKARTEAQKLRLLKELQRFREEREVLEARQRDLVQRARFASIRLAVLAYNPVAAAAFGRDLADFRWIHGLNPFDDGRFRGRSRVKFDTPRNMVVTRTRTPWRATSSGGAEFWGSEVDVNLRGDSRFWRAAILSRLQAGFKTSDTAQAGEFLFCRFQSFGPTPYFYWVGVRSRGGDVDVAEFYFPGARQQEDLLPGMLAAVERKSR